MIKITVPRNLFHAILEPTLIATKALSKRSSNSIEGEKAIRLFRRIKTLELPIGRRFHEHLSERFDELSMYIVLLAINLCNRDALIKTSLFKAKI
jgi:hypothetical protein